jgi:flavodoxin
MKKLLTITLTFCTFIVAMACGSNEPDVDGTTGATEQTGGDEETAKGKKLVIYFSRADENWQVGYVERGNTAIMVDYIKELADVEVFEIVPEVAYPAAYNECISYVNDIEIPQNLRPAYKSDISNLSDYETVFIGGPIWWGRPPMLFRTFFEKHPELDGKTIIPFGTHGGSGVGSYATLIKEYFHNATVLESLGIAGVSIRDASSRQTVENWLKKLGVDKQSTAINNVRTRSVDNSVSYSLNGMRSNGQRGIQIRNGIKYIKQ